MDVMGYFKNFDYKDLKGYRPIAYVLLVIGGLNWGLIGLLNLNLIGGIFGALARLIYLLVGIAAGYECYMYYIANFGKKNPPSDQQPPQQPPQG